MREGALLAEFVYRAADDRGRVRRGTVAAPNRIEAMAALRAQGLFPLEVAEATRAGRDRGGRAGGDLLAFTQQLATMLNAGLQLDRALGLAAELYGGSPFGTMVAEIRRRLQEGAPFSAALAAYPRVFGRVYTNMVRAGEAGGVLPLVLRRLAQTIEEERELRAGVLGAVLYPALVTCASLLAVVVLLVWVVPRFAQVFARLGQELPPLTRWTLALGRFFSAWGLWMLGAAAPLALVVWALARTPAGAEARDRFLLRAPLFGEVYLKLVTARIARTMAMLLGAGVPVLVAFAVVEETVANGMVKKALAKAAGKSAGAGASPGGWRPRGSCRGWPCR